MPKYKDQMLQYEKCYDWLKRNSPLRKKGAKGEGGGSARGKFT